MSRPSIFIHSKEALVLFISQLSLVYIFFSFGSRACSINKNTARERDRASTGHCFRICAQKRLYQHIYLAHSWTLFSNNIIFIILHELCAKYDFAMIFHFIISLFYGFQQCNNGKKNYSPRKLELFNAMKYWGMKQKIYANISTRLEI